MAGNPQKKSTGIVNAAIGALAVVLAILIVWMLYLPELIQKNIKSESEMEAGKCFAKNMESGKTKWFWYM